MGKISFFRNNKKTKTNTLTLNGRPIINNWSTTNLDDYRSAFGSVRPLVERFARVAPYAVDANGVELAVQPTAVERLYRPSAQLTYYEFADALASGLLTQPRVLIKVIWADNARHLSSNVLGYVFLPSSTVDDGVGVNKRYRWTDDEGVEHYEDNMSVMEMCYSRSPEGIGQGVSPAQAAKRWATVREYIADYQAGFFRNGAKPDGMFVITANSVEQYQQAVNRLEAEHIKGSAGHHNFGYSYRPTDANGNPSKNASVEWVSFGNNNKDLALGELMSKTQEAIDSSFGVPAIARGNDATATYSNAQVANSNLAEKVEFMLMKVWDKFYRELVRMCEDIIDWQLAFDYDVPPLADVDKLRAETDKLRAETMLSLVNAGATPADAATALGLGEEWQRLTLSVSSLSYNDHIHDGLCSVKKKDELADIIERFDRKVIDQAVKHYRISSNYSDYDLPDGLDPSDELIEQFREELERELDPLALVAMVAVINHLAKDLGLAKKPTVNDVFDSKAWSVRLDSVSRGHLEYTAGRCRDIIERARGQGLDDKAIRELLSDSILKRGNIEAFADNERVNTNRYAELRGAELLAELNGVTLYKVWNAKHDIKTCDFCKYMDGTKVPLSEPFARVGDVITAGETDYVIDWMDLQTPDAHNNCRCTFDIVQEL